MGKFNQGILGGFFHPLSQFIDHSSPDMSQISLSGHYGYRRILCTMFPMVAAMVVMSVYSIVDGFFVSNFAGNQAFASMNIVWPAVAMVSSLGIMIGAGGSALVSNTFGRGYLHRASRIFTLLVRLNAMLGIVLGALLFVLMRPIVVLLGAEGEMIPLAVGYGRIVCVDMPLYMTQLAFQSFYMTAERPGLNTLIAIVCGLTNIALDALLVVWLGWGLKGAAVATAVSMSLGGLFPLYYFHSRHNDSQLKLVHYVRPDWHAVGKACSNGLSEFVNSISLNVVAICYNLQLMRYVGQDGVTAYGIIMYVGFVFGAVFIGYNQGISQVIAYNYGAQNHRELTSLLRKSLLLIAIGGVAICGVCELCSPLLARTFVGYDPQLARFTTHALQVCMLAFLFDGFGLFSSAWFTALGNGRISALIAYLRTMVFELSCIFLLPLIFGLDGIWMAWTVAEILATILTLLLIQAYRRKYGY